MKTPRKPLTYAAFGDCYFCGLFKLTPFTPKLTPNGAENNEIEKYIVEFYEEL